MTLLPEFRLESCMAEWEFTARFNATGSDAETLSVQELLRLASPARREEWEGQRLGYTTTTGSEALRRAIAGTYETMGQDDIMCFTGAEEALFCSMHALLDRDDHAVVIAPNYQSAEELPASICDTTAVALEWDTARRAWYLDLDDVRNAIRPNTRLLSINFPNNPTGAMIDGHDLEELLALADERGIRVLSDEVYRGLERDGVDPLRQAADGHQSALSLGVMSKAYGLPGLRIGWIACRDRGVFRRMERMRHYLSICSAGPSETLATIAVEARGTIMERNRGIVRDNLSILDSFFRDHEDVFDWYVPPGSCVSYPRYLGDEGVEAFCLRVVRNAGVLFLPASVFRSTRVTTPTDRFRVGFGRRNLSDALEALEPELVRRARVPG
jgi:aspartate/methionine/tyrosine aminotransferase